MNYLSIYITTRHFGGYEEGGWYYDCHRFLESHNIQNKNEEEIEQLEKELFAKYEEEEDGEISSVLGGAELTIFLEDVPMEHTTKNKPKYE